MGKHGRAYTTAKARIVRCCLVAAAVITVLLLWRNKERRSPALSNSADALWAGSAEGSKAAEPSFQPGVSSFTLDGPRRVCRSYVETEMRRKRNVRTAACTQCRHSQLQKTAHAALAFILRSQEKEDIYIRGLAPAPAHHGTAWQLTITEDMHHGWLGVHNMDSGYVL
jgi:hypothetical protein